MIEDEIPADLPAEPFPFEADGLMFRKARIALRLSVSEMADLIGASDTRIVRRWEIGEKRVPKTVWRLVEVILMSNEVRDLFDISMLDGMMAHAVLHHRQEVRDAEGPIDDGPEREG